MLKMKLNYLRLLNQEIDRLENLRIELHKSRDSAKKKGCQADLAQCKKERDRLLSENLLDKALLSKYEKIMAYSYYYRGKTWEGSFCDVLEQLPAEKLKEFKKDEEERETEEKEKKKQTKQQDYFDALKQSIGRKIKGTFISIEDKEN